MNTDIEVTLKIPEYDRYEGVRTSWVDGFRISVSQDNGDIVIAANAEGLQTLAAHLLTLAQSGMPIGNHLHYDPDAGLEDDSLQLIFIRKE
ncbi:MAG TPA: hypothetical protein PLL77_02080 [Pyrinomonadaceae bacterium]|nr:hypothetical protein [Pyrinomonadaceae bacterium]